ncbi:hypothetical protein DSO57_1029605 [Entomophthora muscae]|uniref:Uncharacterized protein n=1 Tax=Entomophthora muscae TaxID=34485 RepID=A0ACC2SDR5_9FUNG|nr:hypothetical protein DSO57_1029605 [Entomophthora muscae]
MLRSFFGFGPSLYFVPRLLQLTYQYLETPAKLLPSPRRTFNVSIESLREHIPLAFVPICGQERIDNGDCVCEKRFGWLKVVQSPDLNARAVVFNDIIKKEIIVAFRPSNTLRNWVADTGALLIPFPGANDGAMVHEGFLDHFTKIKEPVLKELEWRLQLRAFENYTVHILGYSLGGALAILSIPAFHDLMTKYHHKISYTAYTAPRVGNQAFASLIDSLSVDLVRYTIRNDIVSLLPPRRFGFVHPGLEFHAIVVGSSTAILPCDPQYDEDPNCSLAADNFLKFTHYYPDNHPVPDPLFC